MIVSVSQAKLQLARGLFFPLASFLLLLRLRSSREVFSFPLERLHLLGDNYAHSFQRFFPLTRPFHSLVFNFQTFSSSVVYNHTLQSIWSFNESCKRFNFSSCKVIMACCAYTVFERFSFFPLEIIHELSYAHSIEVYVFPLALPYLRIRFTWTGKRTRLR